MEVVAEALLLVSFELLFEKLASSDVLKFARQEHVQTHLRNWEKKLLEIGEVLNDAEEKQIAKKSLKAWLSDLRDLAYDMEDVLDEFSYEALRKNLIAEGSTRSKVCKFIPSCFTPLQAMPNVKMGSKVKDITKRLEAIYAQKSELGLDKVTVITQSTWERPHATSLVYEPCIYGRDADKQKVMDMLPMSDVSIQTNFCVVSIVAMGGMGKTTLARQVYDDPETSKHFNLKAWACVSDQFDAVRITRAILTSVTSRSSSDSLELYQIQDKLREKLKGKKFLLALDDIWTDNYDDWLCLQSPFQSGALGSKIIITTRNKNVATKIMGGDKNLYELRPLSLEDCWSVFQKHAFGNKNMHEYPELVSIGRGIVNKCGGLPLAARALGGFLRNERKEAKWNIILKSPIWDLPGNHRCGILPALRLSYNHLSSPLKRCFSYCAIFPKNYQFDKTELICLWIAEGFIQQSDSKSNRQKIDLGDDYFQELLARSFFQPSSDNESHFSMHDLVNDLAKFVAGEICFSLEKNSNRNKQQIIPKRFRHSSFLRSSYDVSKDFEIFHKMEHLRTFVALPFDASYSIYYLSNKVLEELMPKLKCLRVLSLSGYGIQEVPNSVGDLKHLRYLNLSETKVKWLPQSIGNLFKLQTLMLSNCYNLMRLPSSIGNLSNLLYLDITNTSLKEMPPQISKLKNLQVLTTFIVGKDNDLSVKELKNISHLRGKLHISKLENVINVQDARDASLNQKHKLENLTLSWDWSHSHNVGYQIDILDSLQPHFGLNELVIQNYGGPKSPYWLEDGSFRKMVKIKLVDCKNCTLLPCLGQLPILKYLSIKGMNEVRSVGKEFSGKSPSFPMLESLEFDNMPQWEDWECSSLAESYPRLLRLTIQTCPKLVKELPTCLPSLVNLYIWGCPRLKSPLGRLPSLSKLYIKECNEFLVRSGVDLNSLEELKINSIVGLTQLHEGFLQLLPGLQVLEIRECCELTCLWEDEFDGTQQLQTRYVSNLKKLPNGVQRLTCLKELDINGCPKLLSFPVSCIPPMLTRLVIKNCDGLRCLPDWVIAAREGGSGHVNILEYLEITKCPSLVCFPEGHLPSTLKTLCIYNCENLELLPEGELPATLEELLICKCGKLKSLPRGMMHLKKLRINGCIQLESISELFHSNNNSLESLSVGEYPSLKIIPDCLHNLKVLWIENCENIELLPRWLQNLKQLCISHCKNLEWLPHQLHDLRQLSIHGCEKLKLVPYQLQSLTALRSLDIYDCESMRMPLAHWGLATLTSLTHLSLGGIFPEITSFSDAPTPLPLLPTTLSYLSIHDFKNLKSLSSLSLQTLTSLKELLIYDCPKLHSFCPNDGLPDMLSELYIAGCPLLRERCSKQKGQDWPKISHIPDLRIEDGDISEQ